MSNQQNQAISPSAFVVIGAGLPRTGTLSTRKALTMLLNGPCYHMMAVRKAKPGTIDHTFWVKALREPITKDEWHNFFEERGYRAGVDYPVSLFYKEIMQAYPNAKIILTVRDPKAWYKSVKSSILEASNLQQELITDLILRIIGEKGFAKTSTAVIRTVPKGHTLSLFSSVEESEAAAVNFFNKWVEEVKKAVPEDKLLIFNVKEGWQPLCDFLGLPVPGADFPNVNDTAEWKDRIGKIRLWSHLLFIGVPLAMAGVLCAKL